MFKCVCVGGRIVSLQIRQRPYKFANMGKNLKPLKKKSFEFQSQDDKGIILNIPSNSRVACVNLKKQSFKLAVLSDPCKIKPWPGESRGWGKQGWTHLGTKASEAAVFRCNSRTLGNSA